MDKIHEIESMNVFNDVSKELLSNLFNSKNITNNDIAFSTTSKEELKNLLTDCNFDLKKVEENLKNKGWSEDKVQCFMSLLDERKTDLLYASLIEHSREYGETLTEFNWLLKLVKGTDNLTTLSYPLMQLILSTVNASQEEKKHVFDINKEMVSKLIQLFENIDDVQ